MSTEVRTAADSTGTSPYQRVLAVEGADQSSVTGLVLLPVVQPGRANRLYLPAGNNTLTLPMTQSGILTSTSSGNTTLIIPTMSTLGHTRSSSNPVEIEILLFRDGDGPFFCNPISSAVTITWNDLDIQYLPKWWGVVKLTSRAVNHYVATVG